MTRDWSAAAFAEREKRMAAEAENETLRNRLAAEQQYSADTDALMAVIADARETLARQPGRRSSASEKAAGVLADRAVSSRRQEARDRVTAQWAERDSHAAQVRRLETLAGSLSRARAVVLDLMTQAEVDDLADEDLIEQVRAALGGESDGR